jgi:hypothetical protein
VKAAPWYLLAAIATFGAEFALFWMGRNLNCSLQDCDPWIAANLAAPALILAIFAVVLTRRDGMLRLRTIAGLAASVTASLGLAVSVGTGSFDPLDAVMFAVLGFPFAFGGSYLVSALTATIWPSSSQAGHGPGSVP